MSKKLSQQSSLENFRREAKRWLKALRENDPAARARLETVAAGASPEPTLREVQHALALEYGFDGWTALAAAVDAASVPGDGAERSTVLSSLLEAAARGDTARVATLLDDHPDLASERGHLSGHTGLRSALHFAVGGSHEETVKLLLDRGADPNVRDEGDNAMPLHFAAEKEHFGIIRLLIEHGADPIGTGDYHELEVIGWATVFGTARPDVVEYLLAHGATHNISSAVATGSVADIRALGTARRADIDKPMDHTNHRRRPLHLAVVKHHRESLVTLLALGADTEATDSADLTPLDQAALAGETEMARLLLEHGAELRLPAAIILESDVDRVLRQHAGDLHPGKRWGALIVRAAERGSGRVIEALIRHGASVNVQDDPDTSVDRVSGYTPLHAAAFNGNRDAVVMLLQHGASVTTRDSKYHGTPAGWADYAKHTAVRDLILAGPIDMFDAIAYDRIDRFRGIFDHDAGNALERPIGRSLQTEPKPDDWMKPWWTPLAFATVLGKPNAVRELLELGARTSLKSPDNASLRDLAVARGQDEIVRLLDEAQTIATAPPPAGTDRTALVARFLTNACPDHHVRGGWSHAVARKTAVRLLEKHPDLALDSVYTAVVCGEIDRVREILAEHPETARTKGGPKGSFGGAGSTFIVDPTRAMPPKWEPLLYLCFARLDTPPAIENSVEIARLLLDHGADPNAYFMAGDSRYSPLTGVIGEGEEARQPHPRREELTRLLLERGANPYDIQVFYNIHFQRNTLWYLELAYEYSIKHGRKADWDDPSWAMINMGGYGLGAHYLLNVAVSGDDVALAEWVLAHGADPDARLPAWSKARRGPAYEEAVRRGRTAIADLLVRYGATPGGEAPSDESKFVGAAMRLDKDEVRRLAKSKPELLRSPHAMFAAAARDRDDIVAMLLDLGTPIEVENEQHERTLHIAAYHDAVRVSQLLVDRGAEIDPVESNWDNTPLDAAIYGQHARVIELLGRYSSNVWSLTFIGQVERLRQVLAEHPGRAKASYEGTTLLMRLPGDPDQALEVTKMLITHGADPGARNSDGFTAADLAEKRGLDDVARFLRLPVEQPRMESDPSLRSG